MNIARRMLVPTTLALVAGSSLHADPNDTCYRIENLASGSLVLRLHNPIPAGSVNLALGSVRIPFAPADRGWVIPAGSCPMLTVRHPGNVSLTFTLTPPAHGLDLRSSMRFNLDTLSPRAGGGPGLDRTIRITEKGLMEVGTEEPSNSSAPATQVSTVTPQDSREAMVRALAHASARPSSLSSRSFHSSGRLPFPIPDSSYLPPSGNGIGRDEPALRVFNFEKEMLICLTFKAPVEMTKPLTVALCESHPDGGRYAYHQPTSVCILEGRLNEYFFVAPPHRAGTVSFHVQNLERKSVGQVAFTYIKDHQVSMIAPEEPMGGGAEPPEEAKEREEKRPWDAPLAAFPAWEGKEEKDPAPRAKRIREDVPPPPDGYSVAEPEPASSLLRRLPAILQRHVVSFDSNAFRGVNREFRGYARLTSPRFTVPATMRNEDLIEFMALNRGIRHITCLKSRVTSIGLEKALNSNQALESIELLDDKIHTPERIERILNAHPRLRVFALNDKCHVTSAWLDRLIEKTNLRELRICGNGVDRLDFSNFSSLEKLHVKNAALPDAFLPNGLTDLSITTCSEFTGRDAAYRLHSFAIDRIGVFAGFGDQPLLQSLTVGPPGRPSWIHEALEEQNLLRFIQGCSSLTRLELSGSFSNSFQAGLPHRLTHLKTDGMMSTAETTHGGLDFRPLTNLVRLQIDSINDKNELFLPPALEELNLWSGAVRGNPVLPSTLKKVSLLGAVTKDQWLSGPLTHLEIQSCDYFTPTRMANLLRRLTQLQTLEYSGWKKGEIDPAEFAGHPTLRRAYTKRLVASDPWLSWQAGSSRKSSSSSSSSLP